MNKLTFSILALFVLASCSDQKASNVAANMKTYDIEQIMNNEAVGGGSFSSDHSRLIIHSNRTGIFNAYEIDISNGLKDGCDYIGIGPVFETATKKGKNPLGIEKIKTLTKDLNIPWFAIGGIKSKNISYLKRNGFKKVALISQLMNSEDPKEDAIMILKELSNEN